MAGDAPHFHTTSDKKWLGGGLGTGLVVSISVATCSEENKNTQYLAKKLKIILLSVYGITLCSN